MVYMLCALIVIGLIAFWIKYADQDDKEHAGCVLVVVIVLTLSFLFFKLVPDLLVDGLFALFG